MSKTASFASKTNCYNFLTTSTQVCGLNDREEIRDFGNL